jgi:hypothetical protein
MWGIFIPKNRYLSLNQPWTKRTESTQWSRSKIIFLCSNPGLPDGFFSDQKLPIWVYFGGPWNGKCCYLYILVIGNIWQQLGIFYGHLVILRSFGIYFPALVYCTKKNLATLLKPCGLEDWNKCRWKTQWQLTDGIQERFSFISLVSEWPGTDVMIF